jgi:uncharacterized membrane protein YidH (DUF202 family)
MIDIVNIVLALISVGFGAFGWLAPKYTMDVVGLDATSPMGPSEIRAASGALFIGLGVGALILGTPAAYAMIGFAWGGASIGRLTSLILDGRTRKKIVFFVVEVAVGLTAVLINL